MPTIIQKMKRPPPPPPPPKLVNHENIADSAPLDSTVRIDILKHGLLRDELQGRVTLNLYDVRHEIQSKIERKNAAAAAAADAGDPQDDAAQPSSIKSQRPMGVLSSALKLSIDMTEQVHIYFSF